MRTTTAQAALVQYDADDTCVACRAMFGSPCAPECTLGAWIAAAQEDTTVEALTREEVVQRGKRDPRWGTVAHYYEQGWIASGRFYPFVAHEGRGPLAALSDAGYEATRIAGGAHRATQMLLDFAQHPVRRPDGYTELAVVCASGAWRITNN